MWDETNSNKLATCILKFSSSLPKETRKLCLHSGPFFAKNEYWDEYKEIQRNLRRGRRSSKNYLGLLKICRSPVPITKKRKKYNNLMTLCTAFNIIGTYPDFYINIQHSAEKSDQSNEMSLQAMRV